MQRHNDENAEVITAVGKGLILPPRLLALSAFFTVLRGKVDFRFGSQRFAARKGDIFYLPPDTVFSADAGEDDAAVRYTTFDLLAMRADAEEFDNELISIFRLRHRHTAVQYTEDSAIYPLLSSTILRIFEEYSERELCYRLAVKAAIYESVAYILRDYAEGEYSFARTAYKNILRLRPVVAYIDLHYREKIYLSHLAALTTVSDDHFERLFRDTFGKTPLEYVTFLRFQKGLAALLSPVDSVSAVAEKTGFSGGTYFTHVFNEAMGLSPKEYRRIMGVTK